MDDLFPQESGAERSAESGDKKLALPPQASVSLSSVSDYERQVLNSLQEIQSKLGISSGGNTDDRISTIITKLESIDSSLSRLKDLKTTTYVFQQIENAKIWLIHHGLSRYPTVSTADMEGMIIYGEPNYVDENSITIEFSSPQSGIVYLN